MSLFVIVGTRASFMTWLWTCWWWTSWSARTSTGCRSKRRICYTAFSQLLLKEECFVCKLIRYFSFVIQWLRLVTLLLILRFRIQFSVIPCWGCFREVTSQRLWLKFQRAFHVDIACSRYANEKLGVTHTFVKMPESYLKYRSEIYSIDDPYNSSFTFLS